MPSWVPAAVWAAGVGFAAAVFELGVRAFTPSMVPRERVRILAGARGGGRRIECAARRRCRATRCRQRRRGCTRLAGARCRSRSLQLTTRVRGGLQAWRSTSGHGVVRKTQHGLIERTLRLIRDRRRGLFVGDRLGQRARLGARRADRLGRGAHGFSVQPQHRFDRDLRGDRRRCFRRIERLPTVAAEPDASRYGGSALRTNGSGLGHEAARLANFTQEGAIPRTSAISYSPGARPTTKCAARTAPRAKISRLSAR